MRRKGSTFFLWVEKTNVAADELTRHMARALGISPRDIGTAGLKDRRAVTRQFVSVPAHCEPDVGQIETERIRVLSSKRHGNKLRTGHLRGNRFSILVRETDADAAMSKCAPIAEAIARHGFPNYYGDQRFGREGETLRIDLDLVSGRSTVGSIPPSRRFFDADVVVGRAIGNFQYGSGRADWRSTSRDRFARRRDASRRQRQAVRGGRARAWSRSVSIDAKRRSPVPLSGRA